MIEIEVRNRVRILKIVGPLDSGRAPALRDLIGTSIQAGESQLVLDLANLTFADSTGLGVLITGFASVRKVGGDIRLACVPKMTLEILHISAIDKLMRIFLSVEEAVTSFQV